jgi:hypothetical protein
MSFAPVRRPRIVVASFALIVAVAPLVRAQQPTIARGPSRQMQPADLKAWKGIRQPVLSNDGKWFAYVLAPNEGDASVIIRSTGADAKEMKFPIGDPGGAGGGRGGPAGGAAGSSLSISGDSRWVAFTVYPAAATGAGRGGRGGRGGGGGAGGTAAQGTTPAAPAKQMASSIRHRREGIRRVRSFRSTAQADVHRDAELPRAGSADQSAPAGGAAVVARLVAVGAQRPVASTVLTSFSTVWLRRRDHVGNVAEFGLTTRRVPRVHDRRAIRLGMVCSFAIFARTSFARSIRSRARRRLAWADSGLAITVLRGKVDTLSRDTLFSVVSFTSLTFRRREIVFDPAQHSSFRRG